MYIVRINTFHSIYLVTIAILTTLSRTPQHVPQVHLRGIQGHKSNTSHKAIGKKSVIIIVFLKAVSMRVI